ncbi:hypothetical protein BDW_06465 [Bdellovibrio bacteriovorus W]|nr:hypothetical protein BDW_06465 [Bdellovibrio bacteriovorus W]
MLFHFFQKNASFTVTPPLLIELFTSSHQGKAPKPNESLTTLILLIMRNIQQSYGLPNLLE